MPLLLLLSLPLLLALPLLGLLLVLLLALLIALLLVVLLALLVLRLVLLLLPPPRNPPHKFARVKKLPWGVLGSVRAHTAPPLLPATPQWPSPRWPFNASRSREDRWLVAGPTPRPYLSSSCRESSSSGITETLTPLPRSTFSAPMLFPPAGPLVGLPKFFNTREMPPGEWTVRLSMQPLHMCQ